MDQTASRLLGCFRTLFPTLSDSEILKADQASVSTWDSVAAVTLVTVIQEEFGSDIEFEILGGMDSFEQLYEYLRSARPVPPVAG